MSLKISVSHDISPAALLEELAKHYDRESSQLNIRAGWCTGADKKARLVEATYASQQARFLRAIVIEQAS